MTSQFEIGKTYFAITHRGTYNFTVIGRTADTVPFENNSHRTEKINISRNNTEFVDLEILALNGECFTVPLYSVNVQQEVAQRK